jgi:hypothetical protein
MHIEEGSAEIDDEHLPEEDDGCNEQETPAALEMECGTTRGKGTGVEHVPELKHDEDSEEGGNIDIPEEGGRRKEEGEMMVKLEQERQQDDGEEEAHT